MVKADAHVDFGKTNLNIIKLTADCRVLINCLVSFVGYPTGRISG